MTTTTVLHAVPATWPRCGHTITTGHITWVCVARPHGAEDPPTPPGVAPHQRRRPENHAYIRRQEAPS